MNRFEGCKVLWGKRWRGKETGLIRYAEAVLQTKEGKLYFVSAEFSFDGWGDGDVSITVHEVEEFNKDTKQFKRKPGFISINLTEYKYLNKLLLKERGSGE